jgi:hypothetical protein
MFMVFGITVPGNKLACRLTVKVAPTDPPGAMEPNAHWTESAETCTPPFVELTYENLESNKSATTTFVAADCPLLVMEKVNVIGPGGFGAALSTFNDEFVTISAVCTFVLRIEPALFVGSN